MTKLSCASPFSSTFAQWIAQVPAPNTLLDWALFVERYPALNALDETPQDPFHHAEGSVGIHTRRVVNALLADPQWAALTPLDRALLFYAALFHDIGKPATTLIDDNARVSARGHSRLGAKMAFEWAWRARAPLAWREELRRLIVAHQEPFFAFKEGALDRQRRLSMEVRLPLLTLLARADAQGRDTLPAQSKLDTLSAVEWFELQAREDGSWTQPWPTAGARETREWVKKGIEALDPRWALGGAPGTPVALLSGMPASGKDTFCTTWFPGWPVVSFDHQREKLGAKPGSRGAGQAAHATLDHARELLRQGQSFVWNATHLSRTNRQSATALCEAYGARVHWLSVEAPLEELLRRNRQRDSTLSQAKLEAMLRLWEPVDALEGDFVSFFTAQGQQCGPTTKNWEMGSQGDAIARLWDHARAAGALSVQAQGVDEHQLRTQTHRTSRGRV